MMIIKQAELETVCGITSKLPENAFPEVDDAIVVVEAVHFLRWHLPENPMWENLR